jgi:hypothetical protein
MELDLGDIKEVFWIRKLNTLIAEKLRNNLNCFREVFFKFA